MLISEWEDQIAGPHNSAVICFKYCARRWPPYNSEADSLCLWKVCDNTVFLGFKKKNLEV